MQIICDRCRKKQEFNPAEFRCACGGNWEPLESPTFDLGLIDVRNSSLWRYAGLLGMPEVEKPLSMGAGWTPLIALDWAGAPVHFKLEYMSPTGSFKDRGVEVEANFLKTAGVCRVVEDSSGNAGASLAAYAARTGLAAVVFAPENASPAKLAQIEIYGAELRKVPGPRAEATRAALDAVEEGAVYASHAYNPAYLSGQQTIAWELWEQMEGAAPDALVIPVGQGGLLLGAWLGFRQLLLAGLISKMPRMFAVQPELLAPIVHSFACGDEDVQEIAPRGQSLADGLAIVRPVRGRRILQALRESRGAGLAVSEADIRQAYRDLARRGLFVEPSSAAALGALAQVRAQVGLNGKIVVTLTGSGLKSPVSS